MIIVNVPQRSPEWFTARLGRLTGSRAADMLATIRTGEAAARRDLRLQLVCERLTGVSQENGYINADIQRGIDCEPLARAAYEALTGSVVRQTGFLQHDTLPIGCSLDGDVDEFTGILELKCPKSATHLRYLRAGGLPPDYLPQVTHNLYVTGAQWCDFLSFDDRFPAPLQTCLVRVLRDEKAMAAYALAVTQFLSEVDAEVEAVRALATAREPT